MEDKEKPKSGVQEILSQQKLLKNTREKISKLIQKNIFIISGDLGAREVIKGYLETLGFPPDRLKAGNTPADVISRIKQDPAEVDLVICHLKTIDSRVSSQTGLQLLAIVKDMLLNAASDKTIPFIFVEKEFEKKDIISAFKAGASQFVILPSDPIALGSKVLEVFEKPKESAVSQEVTKLLLQGNKFQEQGLFDNAISFYNKALALGGENAEILTEKGNALLKMGDVENAIQVFKRVTEVEISFPRAYQGLGEAHAQLGDFVKAKKNFLRVIELEPHNVQVHYNVGVIYQDEGDYDSAMFYFREGMKLNPKFVKNYLGLAKNFEAQENPRESLLVYKTAIKQNPNQTFLYLTAGDFCLKHNMNKEAEDIFGEAISQNETHLHLYNRLGIALRKQGKNDEAITNYAKAIKIKPDDPHLRYNLAKAYYMKGEELTAVDKLQMAFELDPELKVKFEEDKYFSKLIEKYPDKFE